MLFPLFLSPLEIVRDLFYVYEEKAAKQNPKLTNQTSHALLIFFSLKVNMLEILRENQLSGWEEQIKEVNGKKKFLSILCICFIARHCHPQNQKLHQCNYNHYILGEGLGGDSCMLLLLGM